MNKVAFFAPGCTCWIKDLTYSNQYCSLHVAAPALLEALEAMEWNGNGVQGDQGVCPECISYPNEGHSKDCKLQAAIKLAKGNEVTS